MAALLAMGALALVPRLPLRRESAPGARPRRRVGADLRRARRGGRSQSVENRDPGAGPRRGGRPFRSPARARECGSRADLERLRTRRSGCEASDSRRRVAVSRPAHRRRGSRPAGSRRTGPVRGASSRRTGAPSGVGGVHPGRGERRRAGRDPRSLPRGGPAPAHRGGRRRGAGDEPGRSDPGARRAAGTRAHGFPCDAGRSPRGGEGAPDQR